MAAGRERIGVVSAAALVVANMIGVGVFTTSGFSLGSLGSPSAVLWAWVVGGVLALLGVVNYIALVRALPGSGGEYHYLARGLPPFAGFLAGWVSLLAGFTAPIAAAAAGLQAYWAPWLEGAASAAWLGTAAIVLAGLMHGVRVRGGAGLQSALVIVKLGCLAAFVGYGASSLSAQPAVASEWRLTTFAETLIWISLSYSGWNAAVYIADEVRDPERNVARALVLATVAVAVLYFGLNWVFVHAAPVDELAGAPDIAARAAFAIGGAELRDGVRLLVGLALFTSISAMVMAGPRVYARMAEDGLFPRWFDSRDGVPVAAVALQCAAAIVVLWLSGLRELLSYIGFTLSLSTAACVAALMRLRSRQGPEVWVLGYPWLPALYVVATVAIGVFFAIESPELFGLGAATVAAGIPLYFVLRRR